MAEAIFKRLCHYCSIEFTVRLNLSVFIAWSLSDKEHISKIVRKNPEFKMQQWNIFWSVLDYVNLIIEYRCVCVGAFELALEFQLIEFWTNKRMLAIDVFCYNDRKNESDKHIENNAIHWRNGLWKNKRFSAKRSEQKKNQLHKSERTNRSKANKKLAIAHVCVWMWLKETLCVGTQGKQCNLNIEGKKNGEKEEAKRQGKGRLLFARVMREKW